MFAHELGREYKQLRGLIDFALEHGWSVVRTTSGHLKFTKPGLPSLCTGFGTSTLHGGDGAQTQGPHADRQTGAAGDGRA